MHFDYFALRKKTDTIENLGKNSIIIASKIIYCGTITVVAAFLILPTKKKRNGNETKTKRSINGFFETRFEFFGTF